MHFTMYYLPPEISGRTLTRLQKARLRHWLCRVRNGEIFLRSLVDRVDQVLSHCPSLLAILKGDSRFLDDLPIDVALHLCSRLPQFARSFIPAMPEHLSPWAPNNLHLT